MVTLNITIDVDNAAFQDGNLYDEALRAVKEAMLRGSEVIKDINGNTVGSMEIRQEGSVCISVSLYKDIRRILNEFPNRKIAGLINGKDSYSIVSTLEKTGGR